MRTYARRLVAVLGLGLLSFLNPAGAQVSLISTGAVWQFMDRGTEPASNWQTNGFLPEGWSDGPAPLGYGNGDESTLVATGVAPRPATVYFRHEFVLPNPPGLTSLTLRTLCDDGAIVYLNGIEVYRRNLPAGPATFQTYANGIVDGPAEGVFRQQPVVSNYAQAGTNVVAVELHQHPGGLFDARMDLQLIANLPLSLPEIQITSPASGTVLASGSVQFQVQTADLDGFVASVRYYTNGTLLTETKSEPFSHVWTGVPTGRFRLTAEAVDESGRRRTSAPVYFQAGTVTGTRVTRGPYLQSCTATGIVVRWRTDWPSASTVYFGDAPGDLDFVARGAPGIDHEVRIAGLEPERTYRYSVGDDTGPAAGGSGPDFQFSTAPARTKPVRIWAIGDSGKTNAAPGIVRDTYLDWAGDRPADVWLMLGDNAYEEGSDDEYQRAVFQQYPQILRNTVLWPTLGNHDAATAGVTEAFPYLELFTLPRNGEAGGVASGTELYYSFDYANIHFVCLDSQSSDRRKGSPMLTWLETDLAATSKDWIIAYWHHPPYTWGTHNSDSESDLIEMRENAVPILERHGVDLVLCGHSHVYERTFLLNGHYGYSSNLVSSMILDGSRGDPDQSPYRKPWGGLGANRGTAYVVCGCSGEGGAFNFRRHPAMSANLAGFGSMVIDVDGLRLDVKFLNATGSIDDRFAIDKSAPDPNVRPALAIQPQRPATSGNGALDAIELEWPTSTLRFQLESRPESAPGFPWQAITAQPELHGRYYRLTQDPSGTNRVYRLRSVR